MVTPAPPIKGNVWEWRWTLEGPPEPHDVEFFLSDPLFNVEGFRPPMARVDGNDIVLTFIRQSPP